MATGLLVAPCAGPMLGLILTCAAEEGANSRAAFLLFAYGAATSLAAALFAGGAVFRALKFLGAEVWIRRVLGMAVLAGVAEIALGVGSPRFLCGARPEWNSR